jgi:hypothetical protein
MAAFCQTLCLAAAGALLGIAPEAARLMGGAGSGWGIVTAAVMLCGSFVIKGAVAHASKASLHSSTICTFWAGGALLAMSIMNLTAPPIDHFRSQLTIQMVLGLLLIVFPFANLLEARKASSKD